MVGISPWDDFQVEPGAQGRGDYRGRPGRRPGALRQHVVQGQRPPPADYVVEALAFAAVYVVSSPWIDGKGMAIVSPALLTAGLGGRCF